MSGGHENGLAHRLLLWRSLSLVLAATLFINSLIVGYVMVRLLRVLQETLDDLTR